jgi:hypothetical protein
MRLRFTIRDLLWLTLVVGMALAWAATYYATVDMLNGERRDNVRLGRELIKAQGRISELTDPANIERQQVPSSSPPN